MDRDPLKLERDRLLAEQGYRCACCGRVCGMAAGDPAYLAKLDARTVVVCHSCRRDPRRCVAATLADQPASGG